MTSYLTFKRVLDIFLSSIALFFLSPAFYVFMLFIKLDSPGPSFFKQKRVGKDFKPFRLIKFRSMAGRNNPGEDGFEPGDNSRVTKVGSLLRKTKLDELPELFNVLNGDMSLVGPRPEVQEYVLGYREDFEKTLQIRPGISDLASIKYYDEEAILAKKPDPEKFYREVILPDKLRLAKWYNEGISFKTDMKIIMATLKSILSRKHVTVKIEEQRG